VTPDRTDGVTSVEVKHEINPNTDATPALGAGRKPLPLGSIGGAAAGLAQDCIRKVEVLEYPELRMQPIWKTEVEDFPAFIMIDDKGNEFFKALNLG
jgi:tartrate dehydratase beta subunit/fumarate hydratase class I family protein